MLVCEVEDEHVVRLPVDRLVNQTGLHQDLQPRGQCFPDAVMATPRLDRLDNGRQSQISPSFKILPDSGENLGRSRGQIESMTQDPCYRSKPQFGHREV